MTTIVLPSNITISEVKEPTEEMIDQAVKLTNALQVGDPSCKAWTGGNLELLPLLMHAIIKATWLWEGAGITYVATDENGVLVGFSQWLPLGQDLFGSEDRRQFGFDEFMEKMSDEAKKYFAESLGREFPKYLDEAFGIPQSQTKVHFCNLVMVQPEYQGKGIASAMFKMAYEEAKQMGAVVALSTGNEHNIVVYEHIGLTVKGHQVFQSPWGEWPSWAFAWETNPKEP
ncbi:uncharacterized protein C8Q71DRAFT_857088 [Rhodofomes roseus]|uniref:N-acetyltransferase domain-containing protein n=1 Tax=Rhodofomes roseus TaxID=34475 RepID=A0A4Y9Y1X5_9APHY|nr:uncharacterized protein C8Q71DRAFT_857088 [Rhodofomes roseus]KAH9837915.1 hypothetical protein C8Q71DRAFT_857088 [Rhodofomes roseus]TFY55928.1 hypothetical protein EVJ58_g7941 [Rhodofomes roseus]